MPLPTLSSIAQKNSDGFKTLKKNLESSNSNITRERPENSIKQIEFEPILNEMSSVFSKLSNQDDSINSSLKDIKKNQTDYNPIYNAAFFRNKEANEKSLERSRIESNPLIPLIEETNTTLIRVR